jgi:hypothetical protein
MRPSDPNDPELAAFLRASSERLAAMLRARGGDVPPAAIEQFARVAAEHLAAHPRDKSFYNISSGRLLAMVRELESELPGGRTNPRFNDMLASRFRDALKGQGEGPTDPAASA